MRRVPTGRGARPVPQERTRDTSRPAGEAGATRPSLLLWEQELQEQDVPQTGQTAEKYDVTEKSQRIVKINTVTRE